MWQVKVAGPRRAASGRFRKGIGVGISARFANIK